MGGKAIDSDHSCFSSDLTALSSRTTASALSSPTHVPMATAGRTVVLFDVDGTLTHARKKVSPETLALLRELSARVTIGMVGGSDLAKQKEQLGEDGALRHVRVCGC